MRMHPHPTAARSPSLPPIRGLAPALALLLLVSGCETDFPLEPDEPLTFTLTGPERAESEVVDGAIRCDYTLEARVEGGEEGEDRIELLDLLLEWEEEDGEGILNTSVPSARVQGDWFQTQMIVSGEEREAVRQVWLVPDRPFRHVHTLRYRMPNGEERAETYTLVCD